MHTPQIPKCFHHFLGNLQSDLRKIPMPSFFCNLLNFFAFTKGGFSWGHCYLCDPVIKQWLFSLPGIFVIRPGIYCHLKITGPSFILKIPALRLCHRAKPLYTSPCCYHIYNTPLHQPPPGKAPSLAKSN